MCISDEKGNEVIVNGISDVWTERFARSITVAMGGRGCVASHRMNGAGYRKCAIARDAQPRPKYGGVSS